MEEPYENRELDTMFGEIKTTLDRIEAQTMKTNGRVTELEAWKNIVIGAISILSLILIPILSWALFSIVNLPSTLHAAVDEAIQPYVLNGSVHEK